MADRVLIGLVLLLAILPSAGYLLIKEGHTILGLLLFLASFTTLVLVFMFAFVFKGRR